MEAAMFVRQKLGFTPIVFDPIWIKPLPCEQIRELVERVEYVLFVEDGVLAGGFSSAVLEMLADEGLLAGKKLRRLGIPDTFVEHGTQLELREMVGIRGHAIAQAVMDFFERKAEV